MSRSEYYEQMKALARTTRCQYEIRSCRVLRTDLRRIYKDQGIVIDLWPHKFKGLRGAYFYDDAGPAVMLAKGLPVDPMIFTMAHELKHHLVDRHLTLALCDQTNQAAEIEIGAEVFAAEFIYPESDFMNDYMRLGTKDCTPEALVRLKHSNQTTLSYAGLAKRAEFLGLARAGSLQNFRGWKKLEEEVFGVPLYKRLLIRDRGYV
jgi:Zn-dependent peptidase ImmA (M78 family)